MELIIGRSKDSVLASWICVTPASKQHYDFLHRFLLTKTEVDLFLEKEPAWWFWKSWSMRDNAVRPFWRSWWAMPATAMRPM
jgi:hypothetical protein